METANCLVNSQKGIALATLEKLHRQIQGQFRVCTANPVRETGLTAMNYMLDTNTCIYLMTARHPGRQSRILARMEALAPDDTIALSSIVTFELSCGAQKGR